MAPAHVLITADTIGGVWTYSLDLARALAQLGTRTTLATMGQPVSTAQREAADGIPGLLLRESTFKLEWMEDPWQDVDAAGHWLQDLERNLQPDLIHLNGCAHGAISFRAPSVVVAHSCVLSWWRAVKGEEAPKSWDIYRVRVQQGLKAAGSVVAISSFMREQIQSLYGLDREIHVIPNGRSIPPVATMQKERFALGCGRLWDEAKNSKALEQAASQVSFPLYVAGDCGCLEWQHARSLGLLSQPELREWMLRASVFVHPARYEPFGLAVLEAALCNCALVLGDTPSLRELWDGAALFVSPDHDHALSSAMELLFANETLRTGLAARARSRALTMTAERMAQGYLAAYAQACSETVRCVS